MQMKPPGTKELRYFGLIMAAAISIVAVLRWWLHGFTPFPGVLLGIAAVLLIVGLVFTESLRPVYWLWMRFALALNWIVTRVLLTSIFALMIIPGRLVLLVRGIDPLKRQWDRAADSYWEEPEEQPDEFERYLNQF